MKTLYVSDIDGTLLRGDQTLSEFSKKGIALLLEKGILFSVATARSAKTARAVLGTFEKNIPGAFYNGAFAAYLNSGEIIKSRTFEDGESVEIIHTALSFGVSPRVFSVIDGMERFSYMESHLESEGAREYFRTRRGDKRGRLTDENGLCDGAVFTVSCVDKRERLEPLWRELSGRFKCHFYKDSYSSDWYLEFLPEKANKAECLLLLKEIYGADRVVVFGDGVNDLSMFSAADESYAVANAAEELKLKATAVIPSNEEDGVVRWLLENAE